MGRNVLFIVLDATRRDRVAPFNPEIEFTEHIDALAERGTAFYNAVSQSSWTFPAHASMFTGLYPWKHGATQETLYLQETDGKTLFEIFQDRGYTTAVYTSNSWISRHMGMTDGVDQESNFFPLLGTLPGPVRRLWQRCSPDTQRSIITLLEQWSDRLSGFSGTGGSHTSDIIDRTKDTIRENEDWFVFVNLMDAHAPVHPPEQYREKHAPDVDADDLANAMNDYYTGKDVPWEDYRKLYDAAIDYMDDTVGHLVTFLEDRGELDDTLIIVVSDHGEHMGEHGFAEHRLSVSETLVHVPVIIWDSDNATDAVHDQVELRALYDYIPAAAAEQKVPDITTDVTKGGIAYPDMHIQITEDTESVEEENLYARRRYVRDGDKGVRVEKKEPEDGGTTYRGIDLDTGETAEVSDILKQTVDRIGTYTGDGETLEEKDEMVKKRLEHLGYT